MFVICIDHTRGAFHGIHTSLDLSNDVAVQTIPTVTMSALGHFRDIFEGMVIEADPASKS